MNCSYLEQFKIICITLKILCILLVDTLNSHLYLRFFFSFFRDADATRIDIYAGKPDFRSFIA